MTDEKFRGCLLRRRNQQIPTADFSASYKSGWIKNCLRHERESCRIFACTEIGFENVFMDKEPAPFAVVRHRHGGYFQDLRYRHTEGVLCGCGGSTPCSDSADDLEIRCLVRQGGAPGSNGRRYGSVCRACHAGSHQFLFGLQMRSILGEAAIAAMLGTLYRLYSRQPWKKSAKACPNKRTEAGLRQSTLIFANTGDPLCRRESKRNRVLKKSREGTSQGPTAPGLHRMAGAKAQSSKKEYHSLWVCP